MSHLRCWDVDCQVEGIVTTWADGTPQLCPNDAGHALAGVAPTATEFNEGQPTALDALYMSDGAGRVYRMTIDIHGAWVPTRVFGPAP